MSENTSRVETFVGQVESVERWLAISLAEAGITGAPERRARARVLELKDEILDICALIAQATSSGDYSKLTVYAEFDAAHLFPAALAKRADSGIQDIGATIQDELSALARERKKELEPQVVGEKQLDRERLNVWQTMSACDSIEEIGATVLRLSEAARYLFQTEFLRIASHSTLKGES